MRGLAWSDTNCIIANDLLNILHRIVMSEMTGFRFELAPLRTPPQQTQFDYTLTGKNRVTDSILNRVSGFESTLVFEYHAL